jgi:hypothetical protein
VLCMVTLRQLNVLEVPKTWTEEPLAGQTDRVISLLHCVTCPSDSNINSAPLPAPSFSFACPLMVKILQDTPAGKVSDTVQFTIDIMVKHCVLGQSQQIPRGSIVRSLLRIIAVHPRYRTSAQHGLLTLAEHIGDTAQDEELNQLITALYSHLTVVRYAALKALEHLEITESMAATFATMVWILRHDDDEAIAALSKHLWEESDMQMGSEYRKYLIPLLGE